jgi:hypothetical protein
MKYILFFLLILEYSASRCQDKKSINKEDIKVYFGKSKHYSGDIPGIIFSTEYNRYFKNRLNWNLNMSGTIHDGSTPLFYIDPNGNPVDGSIRNTNGGLQFSGHIGYCLFKSQEHEFQIRLGSVLRYQSSSVPNETSIYYPIITGLPIPVVVVINVEPARSYSIGISGQILYTYSLNKKFLLGLLAGYQFDTNADNISQLSIFTGIRF